MNIPDIATSTFPSHLGSEAGSGFLSKQQAGHVGKTEMWEEWSESFLGALSTWDMIWGVPSMGVPQK